jgi:hypothetical protein
VAQPTIQTSFATGEWAPKLRSRVDIQKYRSGAALLRNFYVDYSGGGASTRQGTKFIAQVGANGARLIPFQASTTVSYILEFGQNYIRFYTNGAQVLSGGLPYQISTPYNVADLFPNPATQNPGLKFVQDVTSLIICHPSYQPAILTINSANNWTLSIISFGPTIASPTGLSASTTLPSASAQWHYGYLVTAVDQNNQESAPPTPVTLDGYGGIDVTATPGTNSISWNAVPGAVSYNVYKAAPTYDTTIAVGATYGFIKNQTGVVYTDTTPGDVPDFSQTPPVEQNPFLGAGVQSYTITGNANYTSVPPVTVAAPPSRVPATAQASLTVTSLTVAFGGAFAFSPLGFTFSGPYGLILLCTGAAGFSATSFSIVNGGSLTSGNTPTNPVAITGPPGSNPATVNLTWQLGSVVPIESGTGYLVPPAVTIPGGATATATLATASGGNPGVPGFIQERLALAGQANAVQTFNFSQPNSFFNFNTSDPSEPDDAIQGTIISEELNDIRWAIPVPTGIIFGTGKGAWLVNGGGGISTMNPMTPSNITAQPQGFNGANDLRPIKINMDVLYGTNKGNYVRDLTYNLYAQIFTGSDISVLSNHLFFGFYMLDWAWAEEPFKTLWCVRNDGQLISLGFVKEQDLIGWAHHDTNGQFLSVCSVIETINGNVVDAVYVIVQRFINGAYVQYVERMADRYFPYGYEDSWSVDCALQTAPQASPTTTVTIVNVGQGTGGNVGDVVDLLDVAGAPFTAGMIGWIIRAGGGIYKITNFGNTAIVKATVIRVASLLNPYTTAPYQVTGYTIWQPVTSVSGLTQLEGQQVVGVADGTAIGPLTVSAGGSVTLGLTASKVTLGLAFLPQLQTLPLDLGEPTVQGKRKKITGVTLRVADTLGLSIGTTFANVVPMKDFTLGNIPTTSSGPIAVTDLVDGDGRTIIDQDWQEAGNYCIEQALPYPATILGAMPEVTIGDTKG